MDKKLFTELKASIKEAGQIQRGEIDPARMCKVEGKLAGILIKHVIEVQDKN